MLKMVFRLRLSWDCHWFIYFILFRPHPTNGECALVLKKVSVEKHISQLRDQARGDKGDFFIKVQHLFTSLLQSTSACFTFNDKTRSVSVDCILLLLHMSKSTQPALPNYPHKRCISTSPCNIVCDCNCVDIPPASLLWSALPHHAAEQEWILTLCTPLFFNDTSLLVRRPAMFFHFCHRASVLAHIIRSTPPPWNLENLYCFWTRCDGALPQVAVRLAASFFSSEDRDA